MSKIEPTSGYVLIFPDAIEERVSDAGIIVPKCVQDEHGTGTVIKTAKDVTEIRPGDKVFYGKYNYKKIKFSREQPTFHLVKEDDIQFVFVKETNKG
jgi:co-chaperonin GroES (HSP10)